MAQSAKIPNLPLNFLTETERWTGKETQPKGLKQIMRNCKQERTLKISFRSFFFPFECHFLVPFRCAINLSPCCKKCHFNKVFTGKCFASMHPQFSLDAWFFLNFNDNKKILRVFYALIYGWVWRIVALKSGLKFDGKPERKGIAFSVD